MTDRIEIARIKVAYLNPTEVDSVRRIVRCARECRRVVTANTDGQHIIFYALVRVQKSRAKSVKKPTRGAA